MEEISDPILASVACYRKSSTARNIKNVMLVKFTSGQIKVALTKLWDCKEAALGDFKERIDSKTRSAKEAYTEDLLNAFVKLDDNNDVPSIVVNAEELHLVPRIHPEKIEMVSMAERLHDVEKAIVSMKTALETISTARAPPLEPRDPHPCPRDAAPKARDGGTLAHRSSRKKAPQEASQGAPPDWRLTRSTSRSEGMERTPATDNENTVVKGLSAEEPRQPSLAEIASNIPEGAFQDPKRRKAVKKKAIAGTSNKEQGFKSGSDKFMVQITNVNPEVKPEEIKQYFTNKGVHTDVIEMKDTSSEGWFTKRYLITFSRACYDKVMVPEFWPERVYYSQYYMHAARGNGRFTGGQA
jgi:hypothetical protein